MCVRVCRCVRACVCVGVISVPTHTLQTETVEEPIEEDEVEEAADKETEAETDPEDEEAVVEDEEKEEKPKTKTVCGLQILGVSRVISMTFDPVGGEDDLGLGAGERCPAHLAEEPQGG